MEELIALMVALSMATERLVEITRGFVPFTEKLSSTWRQSTLKAHAAIAGIAVTFMAEPMIAGTLPEQWNNSMGLVVLGLLASGGSGLWHTVLDYMMEMKTIKKQAALQEKLATQRATAQLTATPAITTATHPVMPPPSNDAAMPGVPPMRDAAA